MEAMPYGGPMPMTRTVSPNQRQPAQLRGAVKLCRKGCRRRRPACPWHVSEAAVSVACGSGFGEDAVLEVGELGQQACHGGMRPA